MYSKNNCESTPSVAVTIQIRFGKYLIFPKSNLCQLNVIKNIFSVDK